MTTEIENTTPLSENESVGKAAQEASQETVSAEEPSRKKATWSRRRTITLATVALVLVIAIVGAIKWHEQPSFCGTICHTPMSSYVDTYEAQLDTETTDKWGNEVEDSRSMLAPAHAAAGKTCLDCHTPTLSQQMNEGIEWVSGNYDYPLEERSITDLTSELNGVSGNEFCTNQSCHNFSRDDLIKKTAWMGEINPHANQHGVQECSTCHKAHRASVMYCTQCHADAVVPDGWLSYQESVELTQGDQD